MKGTWQGHAIAGRMSRIDMDNEIRQMRRDTDAAVQQSVAMREALQRSVDRLARQVDDCSASQQTLQESVDQLQAKLEETI